MANASKPMGLSPHSYRGGSVWSGQATEYYIAAADTNAYAIGDPVTLVSGGGSPTGIPGVTLATAGTGNAVTGVIVSAGARQYAGAMADPNQLGSTIIPATKVGAYYVLVVDDQDVIFEIQEGGAGSALTTAAIGKNFNLLSGANNGYVSGWLLDNNSAATTATLQLKLLRLVQRSDNTFGAFAKWLVTINNHSFSAGVAGV